LIKNANHPSCVGDSTAQHNGGARHFVVLSNSSASKENVCCGDGKPMIFMEFIGDSGACCQLTMGLQYL
jgi:hypothetical protein